MTERRATEPFETRFAGRVRAYTDPATERRIDPLSISRSAMSSNRATVWSQHWPVAGLRGRRIAGVRWGVGLVAVIVIGVVGIGVLGPTYNFGIGPQPTPSPVPSASGPIPEVLRHAWQRPLPVTVGQDQWGSGFLDLTTGLMDFGPGPGDAASSSAIAAAEPDTLVATATVETQGCAIGDTGAYRWTLEGKDTVMTLTAISADACASREQALAGPWVRSDLPLPPGEGSPLPAGKYQTSTFDPFGAAGISGQLSYAVPAGWKVKEDQPATFVLHHLPDASPGQPSTDTFIHLFTQPRMAAGYAEGALCGATSDAPGVGHGIDEIVTAITARPGVISTPPSAVTIGGYDGQMLDLHLAPSWTGGCQLPDGPIVAVPILLGTDSDSGAGVGPDSPFRLILLDLADRRTLAIAIFGIEPSQSSQFEAQVAEAMPVVGSFEFHPPVP
jgi:hypothetical protein